MENYIKLLSETTLFSDLSEDEIGKLYECLDMRKKEVSRDSFVISAGDKVRSVYLILSGRMHIIDEDFWGNRTIIETLDINTLFGEAYVLSSAETHLVSVIAAEDSVMLEINPVRLFETCSNACTCHIKIIKNTLRILSEKIVRLTEKVGYITQRTTRDKILSYLSRCAYQAGSDSFTIPYTRQQMADYLCVDRSALSHELSKLRESGLIDYNKNNFTLHQNKKWT